MVNWTKLQDGAEHIVSNKILKYKNMQTQMIRMQFTLKTPKKLCFLNFQFNK